MQRQRIEHEPAYVLHARPFGDTSLLLEVLTAQHGRIGLIAKGARAPKSRKRVLLQVLQPLLLSWRDSGDLGTLTAVEAAATATPLTGEPLFCAWYANELLMKLLPRHGQHPLLFVAYAHLLLRLATDAEAALRVFERALLDELGAGLALPDLIDTAATYRYHPQQGFRFASAHDSPSERYGGASLIALRDDALQSPLDYQSARRLLRAALSPLLNGRVLDSAKLLRALRGLDGGAGKIAAPPSTTLP